MANETSDDALREVAEHRGLKLVKSRRRKPGVGDYGKFGLTDAAGKPLLGIGKDGLTASAGDVAAYLRGNALGSWKESASALPERPATKAKATEEDQPVIARREAKKVPASAPAPRDAKPPGNASKREPAATKPAPAAKPQPAPQPELVLRPAKPADAAALAAMLSRLNGVAIDAATVTRNIAASRKAGGNVVLADLGTPVGCAAWVIVPTLHRGPVGRITVILVEPDRRRRSIATRLLNAAEKALVKQGCTIIEVMSDIAVDNAHGFFRARRFEQSSYRFTRTVAAPDD